MDSIEFKSAIKALSLPSNISELLVEHITISKQFTQTDLRIVKQCCPEKLNKIQKVILDFKESNQDLIVIIPDKDAIPYDI